MHGGLQQQSEYSDWWGQVGVIGCGGLLPIHWDSVTGEGGGGVRGVRGFHAVNGQPTVPLYEYGYYMGDSQ